jgi:hypothetical protein
MSCLILGQENPQQRNFDLKFFYENVGSRFRPTRNPDWIEESDMHTQLQDDITKHHLVALAIFFPFVLF